MGSVPGTGATEGPEAMAIAIVGIGCRLPGGASSAEKLWENLLQSKSARTEIPPERFNVDAFYHRHGDKNGTVNTSAGHFLEGDISAFDAPFFSISPAEARSMDPMQRILLEVVYEATESAGIPVSSLAGTNTGCFVGCFTSDYDQIAKRDPELLPKYHSIGTGQSILSNRISYCFDLKGPSFTLDTACSSSLVAVHLACQSLRSGESTTAIVGATNAILNPDIMVGMTNLHFLSPDGRCHTFDADANGYARGEGMAALVLKPMNDAVRDGDTIRAVIRGTAVNSNGRGPGITVPSREAQVQLIRSAYDQACLDPALTGYCEAHGTGTQAGDPLEAGAIGDTFGQYRPEGEEGKLYVGSVKTNIGHLEGASGLAGIVKTVMSLESGTIAPNLWFKKGNPKIDFDALRIRVPTTALPWPTRGLRRASVNGFGYGGTNAHVVIDDAYHYMHGKGIMGKHKTVVAGSDGSPQNGTRTPNTHGTTPTPRYRTFPLSGHESTSVINVAKSLAKYLLARGSDLDDSFLDDLAYTLTERRSKLDFATTVVASSVEELITRLEEVTEASQGSHGEPSINYIFTGQGAQWWAMGRELLQYPVFARSIDTCGKAVKSFGSSWDLLDELLKDKSSSRVGEAEISQPICTALQIALVNLYASWNIHAERVVGHSSGEIAAAYTMGALSLDNAMRVAFFRGLLSSKVKTLGYKGGMMAVGLSEQEALDEIHAINTEAHKALVACVNSPRNVTLSGDMGALTEVQRSLTSRGIFARRLQVDTAYHSHHMLALADEYREVLASLGETKGRSKQNPVSMFSSVTGRLVTEQDDLGAEYWVNNMVSCVRFSDALAGLCGHVSGTTGVLVELGPHAALSGPVKHILGSLPGSEGQKEAPSIKYLSALFRDKDAASTALTTAASLYSFGYPTNIQAANAPPLSPSVITDLPTYSWNHSRKYWDESRISRDYRFRASPRLDLLGAPVMDWNPMEPRWRNFIRLSEQPWVRGHVVQGSIVYPAAGYCCMALEASAQLSELRSKNATASENNTVAEYSIRNLIISRALVVPDNDEGVEVMLSLQSDPSDASTSSLSSSHGGAEFRIFSYTPVDGWAEHCRGLLSIQYVDKSTGFVGISSKYNSVLEETKAACRNTISPEELYAGLDAVGLSYGDEFRGVKVLAAGNGRASGTVEVTNTARDMPEAFQFRHLIHPSTLDAFLQMSIATLTQGSMKNLTQTYVPTWIERLRISASLNLAPGARLQVATDGARHGFRDIHANVVAIADGQDSGVRLEGIKLSAIASPVSEDLSSTIPSHTSVAIWEPDVEHLTCAQLNDILRDSIPDIDSRPKDYELLAYFYFDRVLNEIRESEVEGMHPHHQKFFRYMQHQRDLVLSNKHELQTDDWTRLNDHQVQLRLQNLIKELTKETNIEGRMFVRMGEALTSVLRKKVEPLALMTQDDLLNQYYSVTVAMQGTYPQVARYITLLSHKNPDLEYLEIGAGTGGCTQPVLEALSGTDVRRYPRLKSYTYSDISSGFFEHASQKFRDWEDMISYEKLDIERDPDTQPGFRDRQFDVIIACNVLHATSNIDQTIKHTRKLLRPGGKLILLDMTHSVGSLSLIFGNLSGWWNCIEPWRQLGPLLNEQQWLDVLRNHDFTDFQANSPDSLDPLQEQTRLMIASAMDPNQQTDRPPNAKKAAILVADSQMANSALVQTTVSQLKSSGLSPTCCTLQESRALDLGDQAIVSFVELEQPLLSTISPDDLLALQRVVNDSAGTVWVTRGGVATKGTRPELSLFHGLARALRAEREDLPCVTIDLDPEQTLSEAEQAELVLKVARQTFGLDQSSRLVDREMSEHGGVLRIKRVVENSRLNQLVAAEARGTPVKPELEDIWQSTRPLQLKVRPGGELVFDDADAALSSDQLPHDHVRINVHAVGLNWSDVQASIGETAEDVMGSECSGTISHIGKDVTHVAVGDRVAVCFPKAGLLATMVQCPAFYVHKVPERFDLAAASALPLAFVTAYYGLEHVARVRRGDSVLAHGLPSGILHAALQIVRSHEASIFITADSEENKRQYIELYDIPETDVFLEHDQSFIESVQLATNRRGVDIVLDNSTGAPSEALQKLIAPFGRFVELGHANVNSRMGSLARNVVTTTVNIAELYEHGADLAAEVFSGAMQLAFGNGAAKTPSILLRPVSSISSSLHDLKTVGRESKIVLELRPKDLVPVMPRSLRKVTFDSEATYILSGGLGGIGRQISRWMARKGARNLIFISRRGASTPESQALIQELNEAGVRTEIIQWDITDAVKLTKLIADTSKSMPPVRGVIQGAMNLKDQIFANMSHEAFTSCVGPKVQGSWSLHQATLALGQTLEFFVMLASCTSHWGNAGQSNYAAGCTYQSSLAAHRRSLGLAATSIDVGKVSNIGFIAENAGTQSELNLVKLGLVDQNELEVLTLLELAMQPTSHDERQPGHGGNIPNGHLLTGQSSTMDSLKGDELPFWSRDPVFSHMDFVRPHLRKTAKGEQGSNGASQVQLPLPALLKASVALEEAEKHVSDALRSKLARSLMMAVEDVDVRKPMVAYGVDSLIAVDLRNWFAREAEADVTVFDIVQATSVTALAGKIAERSSLINLTG